MIPQIPSDKLQSEEQLPSPVEKRKSNKMTARIAGGLFFTATVASIVSLAFLNPLLTTPENLSKFSANENQVILGALFLLIGAFASAGIAIALYPVLRKYHEGLALGLVGFRIIEGVLYSVGVICILLLLTLSQEFVKAGAPDLSSFQTSGVLLRAGYDVANLTGILAFYIGASDVLYCLLSIKTHSPMVIRLGYCGSHLGLGCRHVRSVPCHRFYVDDPGRFKFSHSRARDGASGMADRERIQYICKRFRVCQTANDELKRA